MNIANQITIGRLLLAVFLFALMVFLDVEADDAVVWLIVAFFLFIAIVATDALDGYYARKYSQVSDFGRVADPAVDKIVVCGTLIFLTSAEWAQEVLAPWMVVLIVAREFIISGLRGFVESRGISFGADWPGKLKMIVQCVAIPGILFFKIIELLLPQFGWAVTGSLYLAIFLVWAALALTVYSGVEYVIKAARILRTDA